MRPGLSFRSLILCDAPETMSCKNHAVRPTPDGTQLVIRTEHYGYSWRAAMRFSQRANGGWNLGSWANQGYAAALEWHLKPLAADSLHERPFIVWQRRLIGHHQERTDDRRSGVAAQYRAGDSPWIGARDPI